MSAVLEWLKTFLMLYFFLTLILYLVPKKSYQKYLQFAVKNDTFSGGVPATVKPGQQRRGFFFTGRGI